MHLADHIRPLLRDHDCVIIPDFGGLVAEPVPAHLSAARQQLGPPAKQVAFNQALTRNDGLLVDALSQYLRITANQAREVLRHAVEDMHQDLRHSQRTELPGIGVFRQAPGRGLTFDYTGSDNLLPTAFGLPALHVRPVLATDARLAREKRPALLQTTPRLRAVAQRRFNRLVNGAVIAFVATLVVGAGYLLSLKAGLLPAAWRAGLPQWTATKAAVPTAPMTSPSTLLRALEPQQATLAHDGWNNAPAAVTTEESLLATAAPGVAEFDSVKAIAIAEGWADEPLGTAPATSLTPITATTTAVAARKLVAAKPVATTRAAGLPKAKSLSARKAPARPTAKAKAIPVRKVVKAPAVAAKAPATTINRRSGRSYVIASTFSTRLSAEQYRSKLASVGFTHAKVIPAHPGTRHFRVSVADFSDLASAKAAAAQMRFKRKIFYDVYSY